MADQPRQFDDPELKAAVRKLRGGHTIRPDLRELVVRRLAELRVEGGDIQTPRSRLPKQPDSATTWPSWLGQRWPAIAVIVLLMIGGALGYRHHRRTQEAKAEQARVNTLLAEIVAVHDLGNGNTPGFEPLAAPLSDARSLAAEATGKLGRPVPVLDFTPRGWTLDAAGLCTVGTARAVRFHFTNRTRSLSVISIPASAYTRTGSGQFQVVVSGHPVVGYISSGSLISVVGDTACAMGDTVALRDAIRQ